MIVIVQELEILYEDEQLVIIDKPAGLLVHRTRLDPSETRFVLQILRDQIGTWVYPVHRLDKRTSGVLLFTKDQEMASVMGAQIQSDHFFKQYVAVLRGYCPENGEINHPVGERGDVQKKEAFTLYKRTAITELNHPVGRFDTARYSKVLVEPKTGRRHQIRKHFNHISYPIVGDTQYGDRHHNRFFKEKLQLPYLFLHAREIEFEHPSESGKRINVKAELPDHWNQFDQMANWQKKEGPVS